MLIYYFNLWREARVNAPQQTLWKTWQQNVSPKARRMYYVFGAVSLATALLLICAGIFDIPELLSAGIVLGVIMMVMAIAMARVSKIENLERSEEAYRRQLRRIGAFREKLQVLGITNEDQIRTLLDVVKDTTAELLDKRKSFVDRVSQIFVSGIIAWVLGVGLDAIGEGDAISLILASSLALVLLFMAVASGTLWDIYDKANTIDLENLKMFKGDLTMLLMHEGQIRVRDRADMDEPERQRRSRSLRSSRTCMRKRYRKRILRR